jgi:O-antigen biosynthesis protein WbqP
MFKRVFDFLFALFLIILISPIILMVTILVWLTSSGPALYWSKRVGINNQIFYMPKFRTMRVNTPQLATHLLQEPEKFLTPIGQFLRKTSLDEIPQLYSILKGDMSFVGPRPALFNQDDLISLRLEKKIHLIKPGLTGWAQINGRDELPIPIKVGYDEVYLKNQSFLFDLKIIFKTFIKVIRKEGVSH